MSRYRFAWRPRWILSHILVGTLVVFMIWAGFWQLRRFHERGDLNRLYAERREAATADVGEVIDPAADFDGDEVEDALYRRVTATGTYDVDAEVLVRNRTQDGRPGVWVLTPLVTGDGTALIVNRGFVPVSGTPDQLPAAAAAPDGRVTVSGLLQRTQTRGRFQPSDPATGTLDVLSRVDLERLQKQVPEDLYPAWLLLQDQSPPLTGNVPILVAPPEPFSETQNLSYAFQWFAFTIIALVGYPMILRRTARAEERKARRRERDQAPSVDEADVAGAVGVDAGS
jgi:cytochrome oxidase assembly protein ShyY1